MSMAGRVATFLSAHPLHGSDRNGGGLAEQLQRATRHAGRATAAHASVVLVALSLVWLASLSIYTQNKEGSLLRQLATVTDPATMAAADLQLALSMETANTRAFLLTANAEYAAAFHQARSARRDAQKRLAELSPHVVPEMARVISGVASELHAADSLLDPLYAGRLTRDEYVAGLSGQHARFAHITSAVSGLHQALRVEGAARRDRIYATQRLGTILTLAGAILGMIATFSVVRLSARQRALTALEREARLAVERAHAEAVYRRRQVELMTATRARLIRGFSHDLKNPLGAADGYLFMLERGVMGPMAEKQERAIGKSRNSLRAALALIEDLLRLARAEDADPDLQLVEMNLCNAVETVVEDYRAQALSKGLSISTEFGPPPPTLRSDPARVGQILGNIVNNAIKYTDAGGVIVRVGTRSDADGKAAAVVEVSDTGRGIPKNALDRVFVEFERVDATGTSGAGIGLSISQRLANLLGGKITVESDPGRGSTFALWLPLDS